MAWHRHNDDGRSTTHWNSRNRYNSRLYEDDDNILGSRRGAQ
ncbi:hypothetical protein R3I94_021429 [Phoxinus phoxinus]